MTNKTTRFSAPKRIFTNVWRLRSGYRILALIAFLGAVATLFVLMMYTCASHLNRMMNLPYMDYYLVQEKNETTYAGRLEGFKSSELDVDGYTMYNQMICFDAVEDIFHTTRYRARNDTLLMFDMSGKAENKPGQYLPVTVIRDSRYDAPFTEGAISLVRGRHLTSHDAAEETHVLLMEENLAELNGLSLGDTVVFGEESAEYRVVGIFHTNILTGGRDNQSMEYNQIYASDKPAGAKLGSSTRDLYIKFKPGISEEDAQMFFSAILVSTVGGSTAYDPANWRMISVEDVNRSLNHGAQTVYQIALWSEIMLLLIAAAAVWVFCTVLLRSRRGEILTLRALGEKNGKTMVCFLGELLLCAIPSALLGVIFCLAFLLDDVQSVFLHFANQISVDNIHATSTLYVQDILHYSNDVSTNLSPALAMEYAGVTVGVLVLVVLLCGLWHAWRMKRTSTITMLSEKR